MYTYWQLFVDHISNEPYARHACVCMSVCVCSISSGASTPVKYRNDNSTHLKAVIYVPSGGDRRSPRERRGKRSLKELYLLAKPPCLCNHFCLRSFQAQLLLCVSVPPKCVPLQNRTLSLIRQAPVWSRNHHLYLIDPSVTCKRLGANVLS